MTEISAAEKKKKEVAEGLSRLLADSYTLYLKTHNFHWNVTGPFFASLHALFEQQYTELAVAIDVIAERIRALGYPAPGSYHHFMQLTSIIEETGSPSAEEMIAQLLVGQETIVQTARAALPAVNEVNDEPTADLLTQRIQAHEKSAWMLKSMLPR